MKKKILTVIALSLSLFSCNKEQFEEGSLDSPSFIARTESKETRTILETSGDGTGTISWKPGDNINIFFGTTGVKYTSGNTEAATSAVFNTSSFIGRTESEQASGGFWALYPYDPQATCDRQSVTSTLASVQAGLPGTFDDDLFMMVSHSSSNILDFYNVCGGIKFSLKRDDIEEVILRGNSGEKIAGEATIRMVNGLPAADASSNGVSEIRLTPKEGTCFLPDTSYYITLFPAVFENGITIEFLTKTQKGTFCYDKGPVEVKRSVFGRIMEADADASFGARQPDLVLKDIIDEMLICYDMVEYLMAGNAHSQHSWLLQGMGLDTFSGTSPAAEWAANWPNITPSIGTTAHWWNCLLCLADWSNNAIEMIEQGGNIQYPSESFRNGLMGEAHFFRAWAYRALAAMFGTVPILDRSIDVKRIADVPVESNSAPWGDCTQFQQKKDFKPADREQIWEFIYEDLKTARENLPKESRLTGTVTCATADALLAELCLATGRFEEARQAATRVIDKTDGNYEIMTVRFGSRASETTDRYGNSLAAPQGAYWDLFRENGNQDRPSGNKEVLWACQYNNPEMCYGVSGDSWWRVHSLATEAAWTPPILVGSTSTVMSRTDGSHLYKYGDNIACFAPGVEADSPIVEHGSYLPMTAWGRHIANIALDSLGARVPYLGLVCVPTRYMWDKSVPGFNLWEDETDFRGSETMIQRNWFTVGGTRFFDEKKALYERQAAGIYTLTASDTLYMFLPRLWKFSDDRHPDFASQGNKGYNAEIYMSRVAEVYLLRAEAYLALGDKSSAAADINVVRGRAGARPCTASQVNIDYILDERARELLGEEHRWVTLGRLSCNPHATYIMDRYPVQNATQSNTLYERTRRYGRGFENDSFNESGRRQPRHDGYGAYYSNIKPYNYVAPVPASFIENNKLVDYPQNYGY